MNWNLRRPKIKQLTGGRKHVFKRSYVYFSVNLINLKAIHSGELCELAISRNGVAEKRELEAIKLARGIFRAGEVVLGNKGRISTLDRVQNWGEL